jgi:hypothetical protein
MVVEELEEELAVTRAIQPQLDELNHWTALRGVLEADLSALQREALQLSRKVAALGAGAPAAGTGPVARKGEDRNRGKLARRAESLRARIDDLGRELDSVRQRTAELGEDVSRRYNRYWGPLFREGRETSRFGHQVKDFACIYMTRVSNLLNYHPDHYFRSAAERMPHETL